jgi:DNA-binding response OmpR family regulator
MCIIPKKIIVVEDEINLLQAMTVTLRRAEYDVVAADNGNDAFNLIMRAEKAKKPMDLLLIDLHLPGMSGIELIQEVRKSGSAAPVAVITGFGNDQVRKTLKEMGCLFCLDKPFNTENLLSHILTALGEPEAARSSPYDSS